ncbi:hypothetical protein Tco_0576108 [Tanacetum coccineum]
MAYPCLHSPKTTKETRSIRRIQKRPIRSIGDIVCEYSGRYQMWYLLQETPIRLKGVTTRGGNTMTQDTQNDDTSVHTKEPHAVNHDEPVESEEVLANDQPQKTSEPVAQPSNTI